MVAPALPRALGVLALGSLAAAQGIKLNEPLARPIGGDIVDFRVMPDGSRAVYVGDQETDDVDEVFSAPTDGSGAWIKLNAALPTGAEVESSGLILGAGGTRALFQVTDDFGLEELWSAPVDGSAPAVLVAPSTGSFVLSPDGSQVLLLDDLLTPGVFELFRAPVDGSAAPVRLSGPLVAGGAVRSFGEGPCAISPDGSRVVYVADQDAAGRLELYSVPMDGSQAPVKLNGPLVAAGDVQSAYSFRAPMKIGPDGARVVYRADQELDERFELYSVPIDGSAAPVKLNGPLITAGDVQGVSFPAVPDFLLTPDGTRAVYRADQTADGVFALFVAPIDGSSLVVRLSDALTVDDFVQLELTADGEEAVYLTSPVSGPTELRTVAVDGSRPPRVLHRPFGPDGGVQNDIDGPSFRLAPDSTRVVYRAHRNAARVIELYLSLLERDALPAGSP